MALRWGTRSTADSTGPEGIAQWLVFGATAKQDYYINKKSPHISVQAFQLILVDN